MRTRLLPFLYFLFGTFLSCSSLFAASWSSVSTEKPSWLVAGSGSYLYAAGGSAVYVSGDSGKTWQAASAPSGSPYTVLAFANSQPWIGTMEQGAAYSANQGGSWTASSSGLISPLSKTALQIHAIAAQPGSPTKLVAGTAQGAYVSSDGGSSWKSDSIQGLPTTGTCPFCIKQAVYALAGFEGGSILAGTANGIYKSTDGGTTWASSGLTGVPVKLLSAGAGKAYALTDTGALYKSSGSAWTQVTVSATPSTVYAHPSKSGTVFFGTSQGQVFSSADDGANWTAISDSTLSGAVNAIAVPADMADNLVVATSAGVFLYGAASASSLVIPPATNVPLNTAITSDEVTITGLQKAVAISIAGGQYSINSGAFTSQPGIVANGARLRVRVTSASAYNTSVTATVTVGTLTGSFVATTLKITPVTSLTQVFTTAPPGAQIVDGKVVFSTPVAATLQSTLPAGALVETVAGSALSTTGGKLTFTDQTGGSSLTFAAVGSTTAPLVASGTYGVQSTVSGNVIPVGGGANVGVITTTTTQDTMTLNRGSTQTSAFVQSGVVNIQSSGATSSTGVYGGETAEVTNLGSLNRIRIGSLSGDQNLPGDPVTVANVTTDTTVPNLSGNLPRLSNTASLLDVIRNALNTKFGSSTGQVIYDSTNKTVTYTVNGQVYRFIPIGVPTIQIGGSVASRFEAANPATSASGSFSLASQGIQITMASTLGYFTDLNQALKAIDPNAKTRIRSSGALQLTLGGADYLGIPGSNALGGGTIETPGFQIDSKGYYAFKDSTGAVQTLYPVFADVSVTDQTVKAIDPSGSVTDNGNGTATMILQGNSYTLKPGYPLIPLPAAHANDLWWQDGAKLYLRFPDSTAQDFTL